MSDKEEVRWMTYGEFAPDRMFAIPNLQRYYSWDEDQWRALWDDLSILHRRYVAAEAASSAHFTGTLSIVYLNKIQTSTKGSPIKECHIVDGQQRLSTLLLFVLALSRQLGESHPHYVGLKSDFVAFEVKADKKLAMVTRLRLQPEIDEFFQNFLKSSDPEKFDQPVLQRSQALMIAAFKYFMERFESVKQGMADENWEAYLDIWSPMLRGKLAFNVHVLPNAELAGIHFELVRCALLTRSYFFIVQCR
jgi:uncharacterized protein with ParB-like and HNH nuclease domain